VAKDWPFVFWACSYKLQMHVDFFKLFEGADMNCSFPMSRCMYFLDLQFKNYGVLKFSARLRRSYQPLAIYPKLPKTAKIFQNLSKDN
jgi:hypothetical protein